MCVYVFRDSGGSDDDGHRAVINRVTVPRSLDVSELRSAGRRRPHGKAQVAAVDDSRAAAADERRRRRVEAPSSQPRHPAVDGRPAVAVPPSARQAPGSPRPVADQRAIATQRRPGSHGASGPAGRLGDCYELLIAIAYT